jgi:hypothetical protein
MPSPSPSLIVRNGSVAFRRERFERLPAWIGVSGNVVRKVDRDLHEFRMMNDVAPTCKRFQKGAANGPRRCVGRTIVLDFPRFSLALMTVWAGSNRQPAGVVTWSKRISVHARTAAGPRLRAMDGALKLAGTLGAPFRTELTPLRSTMPRRASQVVSWSIVDWPRATANLAF